MRVGCWRSAARPAPPPLLDDEPPWCRPHNFCDSRVRSDGQCNSGAAWSVGFPPPCRTRPPPAGIFETFSPTLWAVPAPAFVSLAGRIVPPPPCADIICEQVHAAERSRLPCGLSRHKRQRRWTGARVPCPPRRAPRHSGDRRSTCALAVRTVSTLSFVWLLSTDGL